jgi:hypothetical protein
VEELLRRLLAEKAAGRTGAGGTLREAIVGGALFGVHYSRRATLQPHPNPLEALYELLRHKYTPASARAARCGWQCSWAARALARSSGSQARTSWISRAQNFSWPHPNRDNSRVSSQFRIGKDHKARHGAKKHVRNITPSY